MSRRRKTSQAKTLADVTINDYANSAIVSRRPKKSSTNVTSIIKQLEVTKENTKSWDDEELLEYDYVKEENEDGEVTYVLKKIQINHTAITQQAHHHNNNGVNYPVDIWFLIAGYIRPEDVGTFAALCKSAHSVVHTGKFWYDLYRRHYKHGAELPKRLQPDRVFRLYGIRTLVIKSLYYMYTPFINKLKSLKNEEHPDVLTKRLCLLMWHQKSKRQWIYYFKLKESNAPEVKDKRQLHLAELLEDVTANSENRCRLLQVTCVNFIPVPPVQGYYLTAASITLSQGFRHNRVQLHFNTSLSHGKQTTEGAISILLDPVISVRILDWWHPLYPHSYNIDILNQDHDYAEEWC